MKNEFGRKNERVRKLHMKRIAAIVALLMIFAVLAGCMRESKPNGRYVLIISDIEMGSYTFDGNRVEYNLFGNHKEGTFKMDGTTVLITYPDGGYDEFEYDAERDELNLAGVELMTFVKEK